MTPLPTRPWKRLSADICGPLSKCGLFLFVIIDEYSRYPVVEILRSFTANATIPVLDKVISMFGIPKVVNTDNGSPFNSKQFAQDAEHIGFEHWKITPNWPRANAQADAFNKLLMKTVKAATIEQNNWKQEMQKFLCQYRATPHSTTGITQQIVIQQGPQPKITNHINCYSQFNIIKLFSRLSSNFRIFWISEFSFVIRIFRGCTSWLDSS